MYYIKLDILVICLGFVQFTRKKINKQHRALTSIFMIVLDEGMVAMALRCNIFNNKAGYRSVVSQNEITWGFKLFDIFRIAGPLS